MGYFDLFCPSFLGGRVALLVSLYQLSHLRCVQFRRSFANLLTAPCYLGGRLCVSCQKGAHKRAAKLCALFDQKRTPGGSHSPMPTMQSVPKTCSTLVKRCIHFNGFLCALFVKMVASLLYNGANHLLGRWPWSLPTLLARWLIWVDDLATRRPRLNFLATGFFDPLRLIHCSSALWRFFLFFRFVI